MRLSSSPQDAVLVICQDEIIADIFDANDLENVLSGFDERRLHLIHYNYVEKIHPYLLLYYY